jgi:hypothetical protein
MQNASSPPRFRFAALWGVLGFTALLVQAIVRLTPLALQPIRAGILTNWHWTLYGASILFNGYFEGYRAFQKQAAPRIVVRALHLGENPRPLHVVLAPFFCTGLFHARRRRVIAMWLLYGGLIALIVAVRMLDQPWRGMIDAGVVVGLSWGVVAILATYVRALAGNPPAASPELPGEDQRG